MISVFLSSAAQKLLNHVGQTFWRAIQIALNMSAIDRQLNSVVVPATSGRIHYGPLNVRLLIKNRVKLLLNTHQSSILKKRTLDLCVSRIPSLANTRLARLKRFKAHSQLLDGRLRHRCATNGSSRSNRASPYKHVPACDTFSLSLHCQLSQAGVWVRAGFGAATSCPACFYHYNND
ncbi:hypothetical protein [Oceanicaulis sp.]|uniref:hypothetical protein n=1 Tax=Oceanicaulis sp. TaxID=1924941 RepID=UPI0025DC0A3A|nr:hypothetical protein [Oceanicaulis sp.]